MKQKLHILKRIGFYFCAFFIVQLLFLYFLSEPNKKLLLPWNLIYLQLDFVIYLYLIGCLIYSLKTKLWRKPVIILGALLSLLIVSLIEYVIATFHPYEIQRVQTADSRLFMLSVGGSPTDAIYQLWERTQHPLPMWKQNHYISYSENFDFTDNPALILSASEDYLLIRRGGIFTDCIALKHYTTCEYPSSILRHTEPEKWKERSLRYERISNTKASASTQ